jgi:hypothetical protein
MHQSVAETSSTTGDRCRHPGWQAYCSPRKSARPGPKQLRTSDRPPASREPEYQIPRPGARPPEMRPAARGPPSIPPPAPRGRLPVLLLKARRLSHFLANHRYLGQRRSWLQHGSTQRCDGDLRRARIHRRNTDKQADGKHLREVHDGRGALGAAKLSSGPDPRPKGRGVRSNRVSSEKRANEAGRGEKSGARGGKVRR